MQWGSKAYIKCLKFKERKLDVPWLNLSLLAAVYLTFLGTMHGAVSFSLELRHRTSPLMTTTSLCSSDTSNVGTGCSGGDTTYAPSHRSSSLLVGQS